MKKRRRVINTHSIGANVFVRLNQAKGVERLAYHHGQPGRNGQKQVYCAARLKVGASLTQSFEDHARNVRCLPRRRYVMRIRPLFRHC